jgi:hypothetical protein
MYKKTGKSRQRDSSAIHLADASKPSPQGTDPDAAIAGAVDAIFRSMPEIVDALITKAKAGSYLHANFLFGFAGADNREPGEDDDDDEQGSMVDFLMKRLDAEAASEPHGLKSTEEEKKPVNGHQ